MEENIKKYELFLDESGQFDKSDLEKGKSPSLIGGMLVPAGLLSEDEAMKICGSESIHVSETNQNINSEKEREQLSARALNILESAYKLVYEKEGKSPFVIWQNNERIQKENAGELYFTMMIQGITNLIERLSLENQGKVIYLKIYISVKVKDPTQKYKNATEATWGSDEYKNRLLDDMNMKIVKDNIFMNNIYINKNSKIEIHMGSARKDFKLMIQDVVCNTYLTKATNKFNNEQKAKIEKLYDSNYIFNINKPNYQTLLVKSILQSNIVDVFFLAFEMKNQKESEKDIEFVIDSCVQALNNMNGIQLEIQNNIFLMKLENIVKVQADLIFAENFLNMINNEILQKVSNKKVEFFKFKLDIELYKLTVYTHMGKLIESKEELGICEKMLDDLKGSLKYIEYYTILKNRESVFYTDCLDYKSAVNCLEKTIINIEKTNDTLKEITGIDGIKSSDLGKALGTRLQAYTRLLGQYRGNKEKEEEYYNLAISDWNKAITQFASDGDIARQYNYRSDIETEKGNYEEAIRFLYKGVTGTDIQEITDEELIKLCKEINKIKTFDRAFTICQYVKIMGESKKYGNTELAERLYKALSKVSEIKDEIEENEVALVTVNEEKINEEKVKKYHPFELIYFYYGEYVGSKIYFDKALSVCNNMSGSLTLQLYSISIKARIFTLTLNKNERKNFLEYTKKIYESNYGKDENGKEYPTNAILGDILAYVEIIEEDIDDIEKVKEACDEIIKMIKI